MLMLNMATQALMNVAALAAPHRTAVRIESGDRRAGARAAAQLIGDLRRECDSLGTFQRQWYRRMLRQRTGLSLEDWESTTRDIARLAEEPVGSAKAMAAHVAEFTLLARYFQKQEAAAPGYLKDPRQLEETLSALQLHRTAAERTATALTPRSQG